MLCGARRARFTVEASGSVGPYDWDVIAVDASLMDPADAAVKWLTAHQFDVPSEAPKLLGDYLQQGLHLLAVKLTKGADAVSSWVPLGLSLRPRVLVVHRWGDGQNTAMTWNSSWRTAVRCPSARPRTLARAGC